MGKGKLILVFLLILALGAGLIMPLVKSKAPKRGLKYADIIESPALGALIPYGNSVEIKLKKDNVSKYDSILIEISGQKVKYNADKTFSINSKDLGLGSKPGAVHLWEDGERKSVDMPVAIISDYMPSVTNIIKLRKISKDPKAYTQGLEFHNGILYESGGQYGESLLRKLNPVNGQVIKSVDIDKKYFAEGLTILNDKIYLLTWKEREILVYDLDLNLIDKKPLNTTTGEGWGICNDGKSLIISDGSNNLTYVNPENFTIVKVMEIYGGNKPAFNLNELEYANGNIYANVYTHTQVVVIEPHTGRVLNVPELIELARENKDAEVINGIAFNPDSKTFYITGKYWKNLYEIKM